MLSTEASYNSLPHYLVYGDCEGIGDVEGGEGITSGDAHEKIASFSREAPKALFGSENQAERNGKVCVEYSSGSPFVQSVAEDVPFLQLFQIS